QGGFDHPPHRQSAARACRRRARGLCRGSCTAHGASAVPFFPAVPAGFRVRAAVRSQPGPQPPAGGEPGTHRTPAGYLTEFAMKSLLRCLAAGLLLLAGPVLAAPPLEGAGQLVVVISDGWDSSEGHLQAFSR